MNILILFLIGMVVLSVFEMDLYLASFPEMIRYFDTTESAIQTSLNLYFFIFAIGMLFIAPLADRWGRKKIFLIGLSLDIAGTFIAIMASNIAIFLLGRSLQALGGSAGSVLSRVMGRELFSEEQNLSVAAWLYSGISIAIAIAPLLGGFVVSSLGWQANFIGLALLQIAVWFGVYYYVPEPKRERLQISWKMLLKQMKSIFFIKEFRRCTGLITLAWTGFFIYIGGIPFLLMEKHGKNPSEFGLLFGLIITGMLVGTFAARRLFHSNVLLAGSCLLALSGVMLCLFDSCAGLCSAMFLYMMGTGIVLPVCQTEVTRNAGPLLSSFTSLLLFLQVLGASFGGFLFSATSSPENLSSFVAVFAFASALFYATCFPSRATA